jgi:hypothetical protein
MSKSKKITRLRYVTEYGVYRADHWGNISDQHTQLYFSNRKTCLLDDHGNGVHIEGDGISIDLNYSQYADLTHIMLAHHQ